MADHGMSIGEHGRTGKSNFCADDKRYWPIYPEIGDVPFLIAGAGIPQRQSLDLIAQPIDLLPTICDLAGVELKTPKEIDGISLPNRFKMMATTIATLPSVVATSSLRDHARHGQLLPS